MVEVVVLVVVGLLAGCYEAAQGQAVARGGRAVRGRGQRGHLDKIDRSEKTMDKNSTGRSYHGDLNSYTTVQTKRLNEIFFLNQITVPIVF